MLASLNDEFVNALKARLPEDCLRNAQPRYLEEPRGRYFAQQGVVALPRSTQEVSRIVRACAQARIGIVPYGGGTGLVGGQVAPQGPQPLIISMERMNEILSVCPEENVLIAQAGCVLADVQAAAQQHNRLFPLSLAAEGSAQIGGNLATNAGGTAVLRYGNTRDLCLGLEAVLPSGEVLNGLSRLRKNNTGYDLRHLLIGAEGTLGLITAASLKLFSKPARTGAALLVVQSPAAALSLLSLARDQLGEMVSAFELIHRQGYDFIKQTLPQLRRPFPEAPEWSVLIEVGLPNAMDPSLALESLFATALEQELVQDGLIAQSQGQAADFWSLREHIPDANRRIGALSSHDISVPLGALPAFIAKAWQSIEKTGPYRINCFGHVGDGNLHFNVFPPEGESVLQHQAMRERIKNTVYDICHELGGSISAEHGVGRMKVDDLQRYSDPVKLEMIRNIKNALDPLGLMNPGVMLPCPNHSGS